MFIPLLHSSLVLFMLGGLGPREFRGGPGQIFFCVGFRFLKCRAGTIYLGASLGWVAGLYRIFLPWALL